MGACHSDNCTPKSRCATAEEPRPEVDLEFDEQMPALFRAISPIIGIPTTSLIVEEATEDKMEERFVHHVEREPLSKDDQRAHVLSSDGIFVRLDLSEGSEEEMSSRILESDHLNQSDVLGVVVSRSALGRRVGPRCIDEYLLTDKQLVPFVSLGGEIRAEDPELSKELDVIAGTGFFGIETQETIHKCSAQAVSSAVEQQFILARCIAEKGLVPMIRIEVSPDCPDRDRCEKLLCETLLQALRKLDTIHPGVLLSLSYPSRANTFLSLLGNPKVLRLAARDVASSSHEDSCKVLSSNVGFAANLCGRDLLAENGDFVSSEKFKEASLMPPVREQQMVRVSMQDGFFVGVDHTVTSARSALTAYGVDLPADCSDAEVFDAMQEMRARIFKDPTFVGDRIIGAIVSEDALERKIDGIHTAQYLWEKRRVVPCLRLFQTLAAEKNGVQMMKTGSDKKLDALLDKAAKFGMFGTKMRTIIRLPREAGIKEAVAQQFSLARSILAKGLVPVLQLEISINSPNKVKCERLLYDAVMDGLENLRPQERIIIDLTVPITPNTYLPLIAHPNAIRVTSLSGGLSCTEACALLSQNVGLVASFGRAFIEELRSTDADAEFSKKLEKACVTLFDASVAVPTKEMQLIKVSSTDGILVPLDKGGSDLVKVLQRYGYHTEGMSKSEVMKASEKRRARILTNRTMNGSVVIGVCLLYEAIGQKINGQPLAKYVWEEKNIVPFVKLGSGLNPVKNGVQLVGDMPNLKSWLAEANKLGVFGTKIRSFIKQANRVGIKEIVKQQLELSKRVFAAGLVPILMPEVDIKSADKDECESILCDELLEALGTLRPDERVLLWLTLPEKPNKYLSLLHHPNCIRVIALSGGYTAEEACQMLASNAGMVGGFERGLFADLRQNQADAEFSKMLDASCKAIFDASRTIPAKDEQLLKISVQDGFLAAFDQNKSVLPDILEKYGIKGWSHNNDETMMDKAFEMVARIITNQKFTGARILGVVMREDILDRDFDFTPCVTYLWDRKRILSFLKLGRGLGAEKDGVQLMKEMPQSDKILDKAAATGIFGTKARSVIKRPNAHGVREAVSQQLEIAKKVLARGMVPIMHLEIESTHDETEKIPCERMLRQALMGGLRQLEPHQKIILQVTLPSTPNAYSSLLGHPNVLRLVGSSGTHQIREVGTLLNQNPGMIATFGRTLFQDLHVSQTDREFTQLVDAACRDVCKASKGSIFAKQQETNSGANTPRQHHKTKSGASTPRQDDNALGA